MAPIDLVGAGTRLSMKGGEARSLTSSYRRTNDNLDDNNNKPNQGLSYTEVSQSVSQSS